MLAAPAYNYFMREHFPLFPPAPENRPPRPPAPLSPRPSLAGHSPETIKNILKASLGRCRCCFTEVNVRFWGARDRHVHTVSEDGMRGGRDVPALMCTNCATAMAEGGFTSVVDFMFSKHPACPMCSARRTRNIFYGMPSGPPPPWACSGGCVVGSTSPRWQCAECRHKWS